MFCSIDLNAQYVFHVIILVNSYWSLRFHCRIVLKSTQKQCRRKAGYCNSSTADKYLRAPGSARRALTEDTCQLRSQYRDSSGWGQLNKAWPAPKTAPKVSNRNSPNSEEHRSDLLLIVYGQQLFTAIRLSYNLYCLQCMAYHASILQLLPWSAFGTSST
jgi:hypothetical protein